MRSYTTAALRNRGRTHSHPPKLTAPSESEQFPCSLSMTGLKPRRSSGVISNTHSVGQTNNLSRHASLARELALHYCSAHAGEVTTAQLGRCTLQAPRRRRALASSLVSTRPKCAPAGEGGADGDGAAGRARAASTVSARDQAAGGAGAGGASRGLPPHLVGGAELGARARGARA